MLRHVIVGDIHGQIDNFIAILLHSSLITPNDINWKASDTVLVQMGDLIDRGTYSDECVSFIKKLQDQADNSKGKVVRLCGNHELFILQKIYDFTNLSAPLTFREIFRKDIINGKVVAAYCDGIRLYTHAGLLNPVLQKICNSIECKITPESIAEKLNQIFSASVKTCNFEHYIFDAGTDRGGISDFGGIFWNDISSFRKTENISFPQVVGHSPIKQPMLQILHDSKVLNVDVGISNVYGSNIAYLEITTDGTLIEHAKVNNDWKSKEIDV